MINLKNLKSEKGFTLIELMIVTVVLAIILAIALPSYQDQIRKARRADVMDALTDCAAVQARNYSSRTPQTYLDADDLEDEGLCNELVSKEGYYTFDVEDQAACTAGANRWCFTLTAVAAAGSTQAADEQCTTWTIDYRGRKTAEDAGGTDTTEFCWRS